MQITTQSTSQLLPLSGDRPTDLSINRRHYTRDTISRNLFHFGNSRGAPLSPHHHLIRWRFTVIHRALLIHIINCHLSTGPLSFVPRIHGPVQASPPTCPAAVSVLMTLLFRRVIIILGLCVTTSYHSGSCRSLALFLFPSVWFSLWNEGGGPGINNNKTLNSYPNDKFRICPSSLCK